MIAVQPESNNVDEVVAAAKDRGAHPHVVDGNLVRDKESALDAIASALSFPDYFGKNLDALYDLLRDLSWLDECEHVLIWTAPETLRDADPSGYTGIERTLRDAAAAGNESRPLTVVFARP